MNVSNRRLITNENNPKKLSNTFSSIIAQTVNNMFPVLIGKDKEYLINAMCETILVIGYKFNFIPSYGNEFYNQLVQNDYQDIKALIILLLPFIDDDAENTKKSSLVSFDDLYTKKKEMKNSDNLKLSLFNNLAPEYTYCNVQYNRCIRKNKIMLKEKEFDYSHFENNKKLLFNTIQTVCNKLFVNWTDVTPADLQTYDEHIIYTATTNAIRSQKIKDWDLNIDSVDQLTYRGICLADIYQTFSIDLYDRVSNVRWLFYDYIINERPVINIFILDYLLPLTSMCEELEWMNLDERSKISFEFEWIELKKSAISNTSYKKINNSIIIRIFKTIGIYFQKYYSGIQKLINDNQFLKFNLETGNFEEDENEGEIQDDAEKYVTPQTVFKALENTPVEHIYKFIYDNIKILNTTWYGIFMFTYKYNPIKGKTFNYINKINFINDLPQLNFGDIRENILYVKMHHNIKKYGFLFYENDKFLTFKNIYNISKSLCHNVHFDDKQNLWIPLSKYWSELINDKGVEEKNDFINKITNLFEPTAWFRVTKYLVLTYGNKSYEELMNYNTWLVENFRFIIASIVFQNLISKGCFNYFIPEPELTNKQLVGPDAQYSKLLQNKMRKYVFNKEKLKMFNKCYYFVTGKQYGNLDKIKDKRGNYDSYFGSLVNNEDMDWPTMYAVNWISQINFFHRYMNNRVMFVTGATGQGKSTQMPKLLLYALKAIDYKNNGKVVCTQPRREPTKGSADRISMEMGVPVLQPSLKLKKNLRTNNYYVQFRYQDKEESHQPFGKDRVDYFLRIVTDGLLLEQLLRNPYLKKLKIKEESKEDRPKLLLDNEYDIVMIDESHEHNTNMDLIMTMMKNVLVNNNSVKLIIVSATMEYDDPTYRRYFRDINDNKISPWSTYLKELKLDRINVDRRLHLGAPGTTTRYKVYDSFLPSNLVSEGQVEKMNDIIERVVELTITICKQYKDGDILIFMPGVNDINKTIRFLNSSAMIDKNILAIPYYSELPEDSRNKIININNYIDKFHYNKEDSVWAIQDPEGFKEAKIKENTTFNYSRTIIVATNIAEASITIPTLKYIIDTGVTKIAVYDIESRQNVLITKRIGETNRLQRRGRIGRRGEGYAYFMYKKGETIGIDNMARLAITRSELSQNFFSIVESSIFNDYFLDLNKLDIEKDTSKEIFKNKDIPDDIKKIYYKQYCRTHTDEKSKLMFRYVGNYDHYDYDQCESITEIYRRVRKNDCHYIHDYFGNYFLVHPEEDKIYRDIIGNIIGGKKVVLQELNDSSDAYNINIIISKKITVFLKILYESLFIAPINIDDLVNYTTVEKLMLDKSEDSLQVQEALRRLKEINDVSFSVTEYGSQMMKLYRNIISKDSYLLTNMTINDFISYIWSRQYDSKNNISKDMINILLLIFICAGSMLNCSNSEYDSKRKVSKYTYDKFKNRYKSEISDFEVLLNIIEVSKNIEKKLKSISYDEAKLKNKNIILFNEWLTTSDKYELPSLESSEEFNMLRDLESTGYDMTTNKAVLEYLNNENKVSATKNSFKKGFAQNNAIKESFWKWCGKNDLNFMMLYKFFDRNDKMQNVFRSVEDNKFLIDLGLTYDEEVIDYDWIDSDIKVSNVSDKKIINIVKSFLKGHGYNVCNINNNNSYTNVLNPNVIMSIKNAFFFNVPETELTHINDLILYRNVVDNTNVIDQLERLQGKVEGNSSGAFSAAKLNISMLSRIQPEWIVEMNPHIYTVPLMATNKYFDYRLINSYDHNYINQIDHINDRPMELYKKYIRNITKTYAEEYYNKSGGGSSNKVLAFKTNNKTWKVKLFYKNNMWLINPDKNSIKIFGCNLLPNKIYKKINQQYKTIIYV
jgi:hypothetical protein